MHGGSGNMRGGCLAGPGEDLAGSSSAVFMHRLLSTDNYELRPQLCLSAPLDASPVEVSSPVVPELPTS